jgi:hypothetical protein
MPMPMAMPASICDQGEGPDRALHGARSSLGAGAPRALCDLELTEAADTMPAQPLTCRRTSESAPKVG